MRLAERNAQVRCLERLLTDCDEGRGSVALLDGPIACGKTELLRTAAELATERGALTLTATCSPTEQSLPFGVVGQVLHAVLDVPSLAPGISDAVLAKVVNQLCLALLELAATRSVLITVDDVRYADAESVRFLMHLARRLDAVRIVLLLSDDVEQQTRHSPLRADLLRLPSLNQLTVGPLSAAGVHALVGDQFSADTVAEIVTASGGNPRLVRVLAEDYLAEGTARAQGYGLALLGCLHRADPLAVATARAMAVIGSAEPTLLSRVAGADVSDALRAMDAAGLVGGLGLRHEVARSTVLADVPAGERAALHQTAANVLFESGADARWIADQLMRGGRADAPWAVAVLLEAAEQAMLGGEPATAVAQLTLAGDQETDRRRQCTILARLTEAQWQLSPATASRYLGRLAERSRAGELETADQLTLARQLLWHGRTAEASGVLNQVRAGASQPREVAELRAFEVWLALGYPPLARRHQAPQPVHIPADAAGPRVDPWLPTAARLAGVLVRGKHQDGIRFAREALQSLHLSRQTAWVEESALLAVLVLIGAGRADEVAQWCANPLSGVPTWPALAAATNAELALRQGELRKAATLAQNALTTLSQKSWGVAIGYPLASQVTATARLGDFEETAKHLTKATDALTEQLLRSRYGLPFLHARGHYFLSTNHGYPALSDFLSCGELIREWGLDAADLVPWRTSAAAAWLRLGNPDQAKHLLYEQLGRPNMARSRTRGMALRQLAAASPVQRRPELLTEALDLLEATGDRYEQAAVLADLSAAHTRLGEDRRARMIFRRAWHVAELCEAQPIHQDLLATSGDLRGPAPADTAPDAITALTTSERRVASLAVMGCTNREIAEKLHITPSTVEQHLTRVYKKLNVKRRKDLPADLRPEPVPG